MKYHCIILCIGFICACQRVNDKHATTKAVPVKKEADYNGANERAKFFVRSPNDKTRLLQLLFEPVKIKGDTAIWKPNPQAYLSMMNISEDGMCHTNIDTMMEVPVPDYGAKEYLVLFTTMRYDSNGKQIFGGHVEGANYGYAFLDRKDSGYIIDGFDPNFTVSGCWGGIQGDSVWLKKMGADNYALGISSGYTNSGETMETTVLYGINGMTKIFTFISSDDDGGMYDTTDVSERSLYEHTDATIVFLPSKKNSDWYDFKLVISKRHFAHGKFITTIITKRYKWSEEEEKYEKE